MTVTHPNPIESRVPFVGRDRELRRIEAALDDAVRGHGQFVLVSGEAGIGKTSLVESSVNRATERGYCVLIGNCYDLETTPPYGPWRQMLPDVVLGESHDSFEQMRSAIVQQLDYLTGLSPTMLVFEDLHWADQASLAMLRMVARLCCQNSMVILATYRDSELDSSQPLFQMLPQFVREARAVRLSPRPLNHDQILQLVTYHYSLDDANADRLADYLLTHGEGNPFFTMELLDTLSIQGYLNQDGDGQWHLAEIHRVLVPPMVRQVMQIRLSSLQAETRAVLGAAAVIGTESSLDEIAAVTDFNVDAIDMAVLEASAAHLLIPVADSPFLRFRHALTRQTVYGDMPPGERRRLHLRQGQLLASRPQPDASAIAHHFLIAGDAEAIPWLVRVGNHYRQLHASGMAIQEFAKAAQLAKTLGLPVSAEVLHGRGLAYLDCGDFERAESDLSAALVIARINQNRDLIWRLMMDLGELWTSRDYERAGEYFRCALNQAQDGDNSDQIIRSLQWIGTWHLNSGHAQEAIAQHQKALELAELEGDTDAMANITSVLAMDNLIYGDLPQIARYARQAASLLRTLGNSTEQASALVPLSASGGSYMFATEVPASPAAERFIAVGEQAVSLAIKAHWHAGESLTRSTLASTLGMRGEYGQALSEATKALDIATELEHTQWITLALIQSGEMMLELLAPERAVPMLDKAVTNAQSTNSTLHFRFAASALSRTHSMLGNLDRAGEIVDRFGIDLDSANTVSERTLWRARAEFHLAAGEPSLAARILESLLERTPNRSATLSSPHLEFAMARTLACMGDHEMSLDSSEAVLQQSRNSGFAPVIWRAQKLRSELLRQLNQPAAANAARRSAIETVQSLAEKLADHALAEQFIERAIGDLIRKDKSYGLTGRELQVLELAADGLTNAAIGKRLYIAPRTVKGHLESIYGKLGVSSRTAAAAMARDQELI